jgi:3-dehydrosphinganine reductase
MRAGSKGGVPGNNPVMDTMYWVLSGIGMPIWVTAMDRITKGFKKQTEEELESRGVYIAPR